MREVEPNSLDAIIDAARVGDHPTHEDRERNKRALFAKIAGATAAGGSIVASSTTTAAAPALATTAAAVATSTALTAKLAGAAVVLTLASVGAGVAYTRRSDPARPASASAIDRHTQSNHQSISSSSAPSIARRTPPLPARAAIDPAPQPPATDTLAAQRAANTVTAQPARPVVSAAATPAATSARAGHTTRVAQSAPSTLADELTLLRSARGALARSDTTAALATLDRYAQQFSRGMLRPEALSLRVDALCAAGQRERARAVANELAREAHGAPLVERALRACR